MFPGLTTKVSEQNTFSLASTITPSTDAIQITDTTTTTVAATIIPPFGGSSGVMIILNRSGNNITTTTTGNIATAVTIGQNVSILMYYSKARDKWYPGALA